MGRKNIVILLAFGGVCILLSIVWRNSKVNDQSFSSAQVSRHPESHHTSQRQIRLKNRKNQYHRPNIFQSKSQSIYSKDVEADRQQFAILQERLARLNEHCKLFQSPDKKRDVARHPPDTLIVNEEHRIIYCNVPKVGCTNWKSIFLKLAGFDKINISVLHNLGTNTKGKIYLDYLHRYPNISHRRFMLQNYTKFFFVRHPFTRILSAFRNKFAPNTSYYFRNKGQEAERWLSRYGSQIIEKYRGKAEAIRVSSNWNKEYDLTFSEFIRFLVDPYTDSYNKHWSDIHSMCLPCDIDYDVIGKYETINEDADYILRLINVDPEITFPTPNPLTMTNSSSGKLVDKYYKKVPKLYLYQLAKLYDVDFELFGYDPVPFLNINN
ncbi:carbohydrate sulfotransferase 11-like isoform X1 [Lytechinus pictus]|uniref:carbohydrate sulfotransferase 11-like isoform X1 n=1 Tax=Lytechinus pictus TaxID=7653 RepID=UPI00240DAA63|nr:carbohydrate sulfotransferase 11-like isoform X1 [Lytechinus pictus]